MPEHPKKRWYVVQAFSGFSWAAEATCCASISNYTIWKSCLAKSWCRLKKSLIRGGQRVAKSERKFFPGYVSVQMVMNDASWHLAQRVPRV
ncbi:hypothetical protein KCP77_00215 [Salmonella enterica subsp. enterica]|nr:hypothetical protein KCP77_00215 [Salmonella enterica subsp. enterica]